MTEIYLIRHTQAEGNLYRMMQGHWDGNVTALGWRQIEALSKRFETVHVDAVYASDLYRTRMTATAITEPHGLPLHTEPALREIHLGRWETGFFANIAAEEPEQMAAFIRDPDRWSLEGAETYADVAARAYPALEEIARRHEGQVVAVVSHGVTIRCLLARITGRPLSGANPLPIGGNTSVSRLIWDKGGFTADYINDKSHLDALQLPAWGSTADLRDEIFDPATDKAYYTACYENAWRSVHGSVKGFNAQTYYDAALRHHKEHPGAVLKLYNKDEPVGLVDLDTRRGAHANYGWVSLLYLKPEYRQKGYGVQVLARAVRLYRNLGRKAIRLHVSPDNTAALTFYKRQGFALLSEDGSGGSRLLLMEKKLGGPEDA